jgi:hypothetical protein
MSSENSFYIKLKTAFMICLIFLNLVLSAKLKTELLSRSLAKLQEKTKQVMFAANTAKACVQAVADTMNPDFCWKKGLDVGVIPTKCPGGYHRYLQLCYRNCERDRPNFVAGVCWGSVWPPSSIPHAYTNFESAVECDAGYYRPLGSALCYRDCGNIGMFNCGIGSCSASSEGCASSILKMSLDTIMGIVSFVSLFLTGGASAGANSGVRNALNNARRNIVNGFKKLKTAFSQQFFDKTIQKAKKAFINNLKELPAGKTAEMVAQNYCSGIWNEMKKKFDGRNEPSASDATSVLKTFDVFGIGDIVSKCESGDSTGCAQSVLNTAANFDPTGLLSIAATFTQPVCDVPATGPPLLDIRQVINSWKSICENCDWKTKSSDKLNGVVSVLTNHDIICDAGSVLNGIIFTPSEKTFETKYRCIKPSSPVGSCLSKTTSKTNVLRDTKESFGLDALGKQNIDCGPQFFLQTIKLKWDGISSTDYAIWYEYTCCNVATKLNNLVKYKTNKSIVQTNRWSLDDFQSADAIDSGPIGALSQIKMNVDKNPNYPSLQFEYSLDFIDFNDFFYASYITKYTPWNKDGDGEIWYMDRHYINCDMMRGEYALRDFQLERNGSQIRFKYTCVRSMRLSKMDNQCTNSITNWYYVTNDAREALPMLKHHKFECKDNNVLNSIALQRQPGGNNIAIFYKCCPADFSKSYINRTDRADMGNRRYFALQNLSFNLAPEEVLKGVWLEVNETTNQIDWGYSAAILRTSFP